MPSETPPIPPRQTVVELLRDLVQHGGNYARDLSRLALAEAGEKARYIRILVASLAIAVIFGALGFFFLTVALIAAIAYGLNSWGWAAFIVGIAYSLIAALVMIPAAHSIAKGALRFQRTLSRVKEDIRWVKGKIAA